MSTGKSKSKNERKKLNDDMALTWLNQSVTKINIMLQRLDITSRKLTQCAGIYKYFVMGYNICGETPFSFKVVRIQILEFLFTIPLL